MDGTSLINILFLFGMSADVSKEIYEQDINRHLNQIKHLLDVKVEFEPIFEQTYPENGRFLNETNRLKLGIGQMAVYIFSSRLEKLYLKVGSVQSNSNARFRGQHYGFTTASTLAKSVQNCQRLASHYKDLRQTTYKWNLIFKCDNPRIARFIESYLAMALNAEFEEDFHKITCKSCK